MYYAVDIHTEIERVAFYEDTKLRNLPYENHHATTLLALTRSIFY